MDEDKSEYSISSQIIVNGAGNANRLRETEGEKETWRGAELRVGIAMNLLFIRSLPPPHCTVQVQLRVQ